MTSHTINCWHGRTFEMDPSATAFLAIDMQRDFLMDEHG